VLSFPRGLIHEADIGIAIAILAVKDAAPVIVPDIRVPDTRPLGHLALGMEPKQFQVVIVIVYCHKLLKTLIETHFFSK
jgi:hypothetical protein